MFNQRIKLIKRAAANFLNMIHDLTYFNGLYKIINKGQTKPDRTGTGTQSVFGLRMEFDLQKGFPLLTTKHVYWRGVVHELLWFLKGDTNTAYLKENKVRIWDEWADENGDLGPVYGKQWRDFGGIDQIKNVFGSLQEDPHGRRHIVSAWNPPELKDMALPPCHCFFQFYVEEGNRLSLQLYQRSADMFLGVPFNIASYSLLLCIFAESLGMGRGRLIHVIGDAHIYQNHQKQVYEQLNRNPKESPELTVNPRFTPLDYVFEDFALKGYDPHPAIKAPVAV